MNPVLVMCMGLGYLFNMYRGVPLVREGGVVIMTHPTYRDFHPVHHPSYIDFYEQVLADSNDPVVMSKKWEKQYAEDEWYRHLYRTGNAYHGVHPFYTWCWSTTDCNTPGVWSSLAASRGRSAVSASRPRRRWTTRSRSPAMSSAGRRRSPISTCRRSSSPM